MVVKPMSLLSKSAGDGVPTSLVVNGTRYSSMKKARSVKSASPERGEVAVVGSLNHHHLRSPEVLSKDVLRKFEKFELDETIGRDIHHPSLHSPEMLSTKGHAISRDSLDELSSLRNRLANLRGASEIHGNGNGNGHHHALEDYSAKVWSKTTDQNGPNIKNSETGSNELGDEHRNSRSNEHGSRSRIKVLHVSDPHSNGIHHLREDVTTLEKRRSGGILEVEKLANGNVRLHEKKERSGRNRHRHQPTTAEFLNTGDVQMVYERDDRTMQGLEAAMSQYNADKMTNNPVRQAVHEIAEKARRSRNRIHHHGSLQTTPHGRIEEKTDSSNAPGSTNLRVPDSSGPGAKVSLATLDNVNRIHQRSQLNAEGRDSPRNSAVSTESNLRGGHDVREDRLRLRRQPSPNSTTHNLHVNNEVRQDLSRGVSHKSCMQSSDDRSPHSQQSHRTSHQSTQEREDCSAESQPPSARSTQHNAQCSPSKQNSRTSYHSSCDRDEVHNSSNHHGEPSSRGRDVSPTRRGPKAGQTWFAATELQSNLLVEVADSQFHLHKFPLLSRSGRLNRLVFESRDTNKDHIKLPEMPGGAEAFELTVKFCYGLPVELTPLNVATLRCAAEYLEMTDSLEDGNLVSKTEHYFSFVVLASWKDSITVLQSCQRLLPWAEEAQIVRRCSESVAWKACTDPHHGIKWSFNSTSHATAVMWDGGKQTAMAQHIPHDWWVEDVIQLNFDAFNRVMTAIRAKGMAYTLVGSAIAQYATRWIPGIEKKSRKQIQDANRELLAPHEPGRITQFTGKEIVLRDAQDQLQSLDQDENRALVEGIIGMLPPQQDAVSCSFLLRLLRAACVFSADAMSKAELERRVGMQLEHASLSDLLIPSTQSSNQMLYDLDIVQRILEQFLLKDHNNTNSPTTSLRNDSKQLNVFENGVSKPPIAPHMTRSKVAKLMDAYLVEVARDTNLSLTRFQNLAESLPQFSRATDDGLYRAVDTYLKAHPTMTEHERKKLCRVMDCQRLSLEACLHAAQNERLPLRVVVQVLFSEQVKLRNAITGNSLVKKAREHHNDPSAYSSARDHSQSGGQIVVPRLDSSDAEGLSLQESWHSARQDIKYLKQEIERMKTKHMDLEHDYTGVTQQVEKLSKAKPHTSSGWTSGWRRLSSLKPPNIFSHSKHDFDYNKDDESLAPSTDTHDQPYTPTAAGDQRRRSHSVTSTSSVQRWRNSIS